MANPEHVEILRQGVDAWNEWRKHIAIPNLAGSSLVEKDLAGINLVRAHLYRADLSRANLRDADLRGADLHEACLFGTKLYHADLSGANLTKADLRKTDLGATVFDGANLRDSRLKDAYLSGTIFVNTDLSSAVGIDACRHFGPSTIDLRSLQKSGLLPSSFLRGCGLPDVFIEYLPSLLALPIQFYSVFISHASRDEEFVRRLYADLQNEGVRCYYAPEDLKGGRKLHTQLTDAIRLHDKLLLVLSPASMQSAWVETEIKEARELERKEGRQVLFPISLVSFDELQAWRLFDSDEGRDLAREVRSYYVPDFRQWKEHDVYRKAFERLLRDLKQAG